MYYKTFEFEKERKKKGDSISILFIAGVHGNEMNTIIAAYNMISELKNGNDLTIPNTISKITIAPLVNIEGFRKNTRNLQYSGSDLNRMYDHNRTENQRSVLNDLIETHDVVIDMHCTEGIVPMFYLSTLQDDRELFALVKFFEDNNINYAIGSNKNDTMKSTFSRPGKLVLTYEAPGMDYNEVSVQATMNMMNYIISRSYNMMKHVCAMYTEDGRKEISTVPLAQYYNRLTPITSPTEGIFVGGPMFTIIDAIDIRSPYKIVGGDTETVVRYRELCRNDENTTDMIISETHYDIIFPYYNEDIKIMGVMNIGKYVSEMEGIMLYQPGNKNIIGYSCYNADALEDIVEEMGSLRDLINKLKMEVNNGQ